MSNSSDGFAEMSGSHFEITTLLSPECDPDVVAIPFEPAMAVLSGDLHDIRTSRRGRDQNAALFVVHD